MIEEIIKRYGQFSDAMVICFTYKDGYSYQQLLVKESRPASNQSHVYNEIKLKIHALANGNSDNSQWEIVKIIFRDVSMFRFVEKVNASSTVIMSAYLSIGNTGIVFDFSPLIYSTHLEENPDSDFCIHCKKVEYEIIASA